jgi:hypothetical protein
MSSISTSANGATYRRPIMHNPHIPSPKQIRLQINRLGFERGSLIWQTNVPTITCLPNYFHLQNCDILSPMFICLFSFTFSPLLLWFPAQVQLSVIGGVPRKKDKKDRVHRRSDLAASLFQLCNYKASLHVYVTDKVTTLPDLGVIEFQIYRVFPLERRDGYTACLPDEVRHFGNTSKVYTGWS